MSTSAIHANYIHILMSFFKTRHNAILSCCSFVLTQILIVLLHLSCPMPTDGQCSCCNSRLFSPSIELRLLCIGSKYIIGFKIVNNSFTAVSVKPSYVFAALNSAKLQQLLTGFLVSKGTVQKASLNRSNPFRTNPRMHAFQM